MIQQKKIRMTRGQETHDDDKLRRNIVICNKLRSTSGESIAETLVAVLIAAFALLMLAGTVNTSTNIVIKSKEVLKSYYSLNNSLENRDISNSEYSEYYETGDANIALGGKTIPVNLYKNTRINAKPVVVYDRSEGLTGTSSETPDE